MVPLKDLNYFPLDVESNIYGMTTLEFDDKTSKLLVATLDCQIYCINYCKFKPHTREVEFTYIPNGARIISIGALKRGPNDFVIGITHSLAPNVQKSSSRTSSSHPNRDSLNDFGRSMTYYFNIYASGSAASNHFDLDYVAQGCQTIRLRYVPYHLYQTELISFNECSSIKMKPFWLLSGGDNCIHAFCEDKPYQSFAEVSIEECFPELTNIPNLALWIDVMNVERDSGSFYERIIALSLEDGTVKLYSSVIKPNNICQLIRESIFDSYATIVPSVRLFVVDSAKKSKLGDALKVPTHCDQEGTNAQINLLVVSSTEESLVFEDVSKCGLESSYQLCDSKRLDCAVTSAIGDVNIDGYNELLIGTHGRELMVYQYNPRTKRYCLEDISELNHPIYAISVLDLTGDALKEVTVLLANGILVLQASIRSVLGLCKRRVEAVTNMLTQSDSTSIR